MRRFFSSVLFFLAGVGLGIWGWSELRQSVDQKRDEAAFDREVASSSAQPPAQPQPGPQSRAQPPIVTKATKSRGHELVGRLTIQRIDLRAMIREGDDDNTLDVALGHIPGTALPGQRGNVGVAGHRDRLFSRLAEVARDDEIQLQTPSKTYTYKVDEMSIVTPQNVSVLAAGHGSQLTLVTCYPFHYIGAAPKRYIVKAHLVSQGRSASADDTGTHE